MLPVTHRGAGPSRLRVISRFAIVGTATLVLAAGCKKESKNPVDYLPQVSGGYLAINAEKMESSPSLQRFSDIIEKQSGQTFAETGMQNLQKAYIAFDVPDVSQGQPTADSMKYYGALIGSTGFSNDVVEVAKSSGATESKVADRDVYTSGTDVMSPVAAHAVIISNNTGNLERMIGVSEKKETGARASAQFGEVDLQVADHAIAFAMDAKPLVAQIKPALEQNPMAAAHKPAVDALDDVTMLSFTLDWDTHPVMEILLHIADKDKANTLSGTLNGFLTMGKAFAAQDPQIAQIVNPLQAETNAAGVVMKIEVPAEIANKLFDQLESGSLPAGLPGQGAQPGFGAPPAFPQTGAF